MYVGNIYVRTEPYSLDCHRGTKVVYHCALEKIMDFCCTQNWVSDSDRSRTVGRSEFRRAGLA